MSVYLLLVGSYCLGSLPFGLWIAYAARGVDIRTVGSGNIGATNVWRVCGPKAGSAAFTLDVLKGLLPVIAGKMLLPGNNLVPILAGMLAIIGHTFSMFLKFKGGKGIATSLGVLIAAAPKIILLAAAVFIVEMFTLGYVSLGNIIAAVAVPVLIRIFYPHNTYLFVMGICASVLTIYKHRANIRRLINHTEPKARMPWNKRVTSDNE